MDRPTRNSSDEGKDEDCWEIVTDLLFATVDTVPADNNVSAA